MIKAVVPERCQGSTRLLGCRSQVWWDLEGLFSQAAGGQEESDISGRESCLKWDLHVKHLRWFQSRSASVFTHRHVGSTAGAAGLGLGVHEASADAKVAQFDLAFSVQEDVGGFDVSVDDTMFFFQVQQRLYYLEQKHVFWFFLKQKKEVGHFSGR